MLKQIAQPSTHRNIWKVKYNKTCTSVPYLGTYWGTYRGTKVDIKWWVIIVYSVFIIVSPVIAQSLDNLSG